MRRWFLSIILLLMTSPLWAQDGLNLPAALFVLNPEGQVSRYGLGVEGVRTVTPDGEFVVDFGVAPDGVWLAYRTERGLTLYNPYSGQNVSIDGALAGVPSVRGRGETIAWNAAGDALAVTTLTGGRVYINTQIILESGAQFTPIELSEAPFVQVMWSPDDRYLAAEAEGGIWWLYRRENESILLTSVILSSDGLAWYNDTTVVFAPAEGGLSLMDLNAANAQTALLDDTWVYRLPVLRPDGTLVVFGRQKDDPEVPEAFARLVGLPAGEPRIENIGEVAIDLSNLRWTPDNQLMLAFSGGALALLNPVNGGSFPMPIAGAAAYSWGPPGLPPSEGPQTSAPLFFLADDDSGVAQVWRLAGDGSQPEMLTSIDAPVEAFAAAPDGDSIAYVSGGRLLAQALDDTDPIQLSQVSTAPNQWPGVTQPSFSPDSQQIAYNDGGIWVVPASGGEPQQIIADEISETSARHFMNPVFAPNINAFLVRVQRENITVPGVLDPNTGEVIEIALEQQAEWLRDGRLVLYGIADGVRPGGLSIAGTGSLNQPAQFLPDILSVQSVREISPNQLRLVLPTHLVGPRSLRVAGFDVTTGQLSAAQTGGFIIDPVLSPDGTFAAGYVYRAPQTGVDDDGRGPLTIINLATNEQVVLSQPAEAWDFTWTQP
jgi:Tol biopolymer transport system component